MVVPTRGFTPLSGLGDYGCDGTCLAPSADGQSCDECLPSSSSGGDTTTTTLNLPPGFFPPGGPTGGDVSTPTFAAPVAGQTNLSNACWPGYTCSIVNADGSCGGCVPTSSSGPSVTDAYYDSNGNMVLRLSNGTYRSVSPQGTVTTGSGSPTMSSTGGSVTGPQASAWASAINSLAQAGVRIGTVAMLQPGQTLLPNGTIVGSGQAIVTPLGAVNSSFFSVLTNPMFLIGAGAILLLALAEGR